MKPVRCALAAALLTAIPAWAPAQDAPADFRDQVETLALDAPLDSRGQLGGVAVDQLGFVYVANFRDSVWKITPEGEAERLTGSLYGSSGIGIDSRGRLYQSNFFGDTITRISRTGEVEYFVTEGLAGPVGIAVGEGGELYVCNCRGNTISRVSPGGKAELFAESELFACPNGITFDDAKQLYVSSFNSQDLVRISPEGEVSKFVTLPGGAGNAHLAFSKGFFYVTKIISNRVVKVSAAGEITPLAGTGASGHDDGPALEATFFRPNGIAVSPQGDILYVNTLMGEYGTPKPSRVTLRTIRLVTLRGVLEEALAGGGAEALEAVYARYKADPVRGKENTAGEMISYGYSLLSGRKANEAFVVFSLNAGSYPELPAAQFHLGEAYRYTGQTEKAVAQYRKVLELDPEHKQASARLEALGQ